jgi:hypothetical protein
MATVVIPTAKLELGHGRSCRGAVRHRSEPPRTEYFFEVAEALSDFSFASCQVFQIRFRSKLGGAPSAHVLAKCKFRMGSNIIGLKTVW